ncbi:MAG: ABC transporter permease [Spirochaetales bacterium]
MKWPVLWTVAHRNLAEHRRRTLSVGGIMALGLALVIVGNGFLDAATEGLRQSYRDKYTGDLFLAAPTKASITVFGSDPGPDAETVLPLSGFSTVETVLNASPVVAHWSGQNVAPVLLLVGEKASGMIQVLGIDPDRYQAAFPQTLTFEQGGYWKPGDRGLILNADTLASLNKRAGTTRGIGDTLNVSLAVAGGKIVELPLTGITTEPVEQGPLSRIGWCDSDSLRLLKGYTLEASATTANAEIIDEDALFSGDSPDLAGSSGINLDSITSGGIGRPVALTADPQAWEIVTVGLKNGVDSEAARQILSKALAQAGAEVQVQDWLVGAGRSATPVVAMKSAFSLVILIIALVAVFIVTNALLISVSERTSEIGTMRALGGRRRVIRNLILLEVLFLGVGAGAVGVALAWLVLGLTNLVGLTVDSVFLQMLFSGKQVKPVLSPLGSLLAWAQMVAVALMAGLYPAQTALRLSPLKAIQSD